MNPLYSQATIIKIKFQKMHRIYERKKVTLTIVLAKSVPVALPTKPGILPMKTTGARALISLILSLYSGRSDAIMKKEVVPCEWPT